MFKDRKDAAIQLARALETFRYKHAMVLGIPKGGVETAYHVARELEADFSILVCQKLGYLDRPEVGFGAIAEDGSLYLNTEMCRHIPPEFIEKELASKKEEIEHRKRFLRHGQPIPSLRYRLVILVDDGIATGATLFAAIKMCKNQGARTIIVASPVAAWETKIELAQLANEVIVLETPIFFGSVSRSYISFENLTDQETLGFIIKWEYEKSILVLRKQRDIL